jgi:hypothetical protein
LNLQFAALMAASCVLVQQILLLDIINEGESGATKDGCGWHVQHLVYMGVTLELAFSSTLVLYLPFLGVCNLCICYQVARTGQWYLNLFYI